MKKTNTFEWIGFASLVAGLVLSQGCRTTYTEQVSAEDLSLRPMPESLAPEATGDVVPLEAPQAKETPYWKQVQQQGGAEADPYAEGVEPAKAAVQPGAPSYTSYTIKKGDTISHVAVRYGLRWQDVAAVNPGVNINKIRVGQVIRLPGSIDLSKPKTKVARKASKSTGASTGSGSVYIVKKNDILGRIARAHGVRIADIKKANNLKSDFIREGQKLVIPGKGVSVKAEEKPRVKPPAPKKEVGEAPVVKPEPKADPIEALPPVVTPPPAEELDADFLADPLAVEAPVVAPPPAVPPAPVVAPATPAPAAPAPQKAVAEPAGATFSYRVLENEDLYEVGIHWGVPTGEIKALNPGCIGEGGKIVPGTVLKIPAGAVAQ